MIQFSFYCSFNRYFWTHLNAVGSFVLLTILTVLLGVIMASAQTPTGRLTGVVSSVDGLIPNATVTATFNATGKTQTVVSDQEGAFQFPQLEPGLYTVTVNATGFKNYVANEVKIDVGRDYNLTPTLEVGNIQETVTVTAGADVITSTTAQVSNTVSPQQILSLPLVTRDPLNLTTLQAGTTRISGQGTSINGMRTNSTNTTRDGISINDAFIRANATDLAASRPTVDDTGEFTISTANQEASSTGGGAQIQLVTPRGTKDFHGALFAYNRNSGFAANNFFNNRSGTPRPFRNRNNFGGKVGGPLPIFNFGEGGPMFLKDKGFFFFAYEKLIDPVSTPDTRTILTPSARAGTFTFNRATAGSPITSGNILCPSGDVNSVCTVPNILTFAQSLGFQGIASTINPVIQERVLSLLPAAGNNTSIGDNLNTTGFNLNRDFSTKRFAYTTRVDVDATDKDTFNAVLTYNREDVSRPDVDVATFTQTPDATQFSLNKSLAFTYRRTVSNNILNEFRAGILTQEVPFDRTSEPPSFLLGPQGTTNLANTQLAGIISSPENIFLDQGRFNKVFTFADNVDVIVGKHSFRFGGQYQKYKVNSFNDFGTIPNYTLGTTSVNTATNTTLATTNFANVGGTGSLINTTQLGTANGLLALLGGLVSGGTQAFNTTSPTSGFQTAQNLAPFRNSNHALYVQDRWAVTPGLTLTLGVRYELFPALKINNGLALEPVIADFNNPEASLLNRNGTFNIVGTNSGKEFQYYKTDYNNFAPSIGIAYSPNFEKGIGSFLFGSSGRTVIRGGYSEVYVNDSIITSISGTLNGNVGLGRATSSAIGPTGTTQLNDRLGGNLTGIGAPAFIAPPRTFLQNNTNVQGFFGVANLVDANLQIPKVRQYSFGIQREIFGNMAFEIRYVGTSSNNQFRGIELNEIDVVNNGFLTDFRRAQANLALTGTTAFCNPTTVAGCQALSLFRTGTGASQIGTGPLVVGTNVTATTFNTQLRNGNPADLAQSFIAGNLNNHPTVASPNNTPFVNFYANPAIGSIEYFTNASKYNYNGLQLELRRRFSQGVYFQANYTFSKNLTDAAGTSQGLFEPLLLNERPELEYTRADYDQTHAFNFNGIVQLPFGKGKMFLNQGGIVDKIFGGFELSGLAQWSSGAPITFVDARGSLNRGVRSGRQTANSNLTVDEIRNLIGIFRENGNVYFINPSIVNSSGQASVGYVNPALPTLNANTTFSGQAFFSVPEGQTGNLPRAIVNGPRNHRVNMALLKNIRFTESTRLQLRVEAFNVFNRTVFRHPTQFASITSTTFGQITSTAVDARELQFAFRFEF
jgi:hypothetical protein